MSKKKDTLIVEGDKGVEELPRLNPFPLFWKILTFSPVLYLGVVFFRSLIFAGFPQASGLITRDLLRHLSASWFTPRNATLRTAE
ncbi:MAG: hypothetical protein P1S60_12430 [Anaerolineae bacterium]|nr:hypothetical protein [Anaerolineae bacterium]